LAGLSKKTIGGVSTLVLTFFTSLHSYLIDVTPSIPSATTEQNKMVSGASEKPADSIEITKAQSVSETPASPPISSSTGTSGPQNIKTTISIGKNETLTTVLTGLGFDRKQAAHAIAELQKIYNPRALKQGQDLSVDYTAASEGIPAQLNSLNFKTSAGNSIELKYDKGQFIAQKIDLKLTKTLRKVEGTINSNFYSAALKRGVPASIVKEAISALSYDVNWQHDPKSGDEFKLLFEAHEDEDGNIIKVGDLKFAAFAPQGNWRRIYAFKTASGCGFYNDKGESVVRCLLATPIDSTKMRITSRFGRRTHPILGYSKMHKGIDFGAPTGTPVASAGDGIVVKAGWNGNYGNYVLVKHNNQYSTAYAHLSKIHVKVGQRIRQRQNIGAVGTTGRSTGPHLHYEVISNGQQVNPLSIKQLPAVRLNKKELAKFQEIKAQCDVDISKATSVTQLATAGVTPRIG
jgi:murein DD-endopeptidase MepM/ murein hydrolase activator NlpD